MPQAKLWGQFWSGTIEGLTRCCLHHEDLLLLVEALSSGPDGPAVAWAVGSAIDQKASGTNTYKNPVLPFNRICRCLPRPDSHRSPYCNPCYNRRTLTWVLPLTTSSLNPTARDDLLCRIRSCSDACTAGSHLGLMPFLYSCTKPSQAGLCIPAIGRLFTRKP